MLPLLAVGLAVVLLGDAPYEALSRNAPGIETSMASGLLRAVVVVASTWCVGSLVYAVLVRQRSGADRFVIGWWDDSRPIAWSAGVWAATAGALVFVDAADAGGQPLTRLLEPGAVAYLTAASYLPTAWIVTAALAAVIAAGVILSRTWQAHAVFMALALLAVLPPVLVTQVLVGPNHDFGSDAATLGTPAVTVLAGLIAVAHQRLTRGPRPGAVSLTRLWRLIGLAWLVAAVTDVVLAVVESAGSPLLSTPTGWLLLARFSLDGLLLVPVVRALRAPAGQDLRLRRRRAARSMRAALLPAVLLLAAGLVMTRIPPPQYFVPTSIAQIFFGYDVTAAPTLTVLAFDWRPNLLFLTLAATAVGLYLAGVVALRRRGDAWPAGRTAAWLLGWAVIVTTTTSGLGKYSSASFSLHMVLHMALNMLGPLLLVLAGPITLALRALPAHGRSRTAGVREWISAMLAWRITHVLFSPLLVFVRFVGAYYLLYFSPIFEQALRYHWAHQLMNLEFVAIGVMFYGLVIGVDPPPRPVPHVGKLGMVLAAMPFHAFFGVAVMTTDSVIAGDFYRYVDAPWMGGLLADQAVGGGIAWAAGEIPLVIVIIALVTQWAGQDKRVAARLDRHLDRGTDDSWDAYNAMLARLETRDGETQGTPREPAGP